jgi:protein-S-isoprenylcysteine O-methyltransferase Ste14
MTSELPKASKGKLIFSLIYIFAMPALMIYLSGNLYWIEGWIFAIWFISLYSSTMIYLYLKDPELLKERFRSRFGDKKEQKSWDKLFLVILFITYIFWYIIMPLDAEKYKWTAHFPIFFKILGGIALIISFFFTYRAFTDNTFLSPIIRLQEERNQYVVSTGVYGVIRHPMYLGAILMFLGVPMLLGSKFGIIGGIIMSIGIIARIFGEEKVLTQGLEGYAEYKQKVRYRLIPFIW